MKNNLQKQNTTKKWMIVVTIMMVAILEVLDSTIVNVALPNMMPSLGANQSQITWVLTSYVVAAAMMLPLTGFFSQRFGTKNLLLFDIIGFMISSFLCGTANQLNVMILYRLLQGGFGAALIPLSQAILREIFPLEEQGNAMVIWGLGIMAAPVFGPTLGGYIVANSSWRWIFYMNAPICFLGLIMTMVFIPAFEKQPRKIDVLGVVFMFSCIGCLQIFLDKGNENGWFHSNFIVIIGLISLISGILFWFRSRAHDSPVITFAIFRDRNFTMCTILLAAFCGCLFGFVTLEPIMLENLFHYTPLLAGKTMITIGLSSAVSMGLSSFLMTRIKVKYILVLSLLLASAGAYYFSTMTLSSTQDNFRIGNAFFGLGLGFFMVPLTTYSLATLPTQYITEAAGLFAYGRMLGTSVGVSLLSTLVTRETQINWSHISAHISLFNSHFQAWLNHQHLSVNTPKALVELQMMISSQSNMIAFLDAYYLIAALMIVLIPFVLMMKHVELKEGQQSTGH